MPLLFSASPRLCGELLQILKTQNAQEADTNILQSITC